MPEFQKHFLNEDHKDLNIHINLMHQASLDVIDASLSGRMTGAEEAAYQMFKSLQVVKALNSKKVKRDEQEMLALDARKVWF